MVDIFPGFEIRKVMKVNPEKHFTRSYIWLRHKLGKVSSPSALFIKLRSPSDVLLKGNWKYLSSFRPFWAPKI